MSILNWNPWNKHNSIESGLTLLLYQRWSLHWMININLPFDGRSPWQNRIKSNSVCCLTCKMKCFHQFLISLCTALGILFDMEEQEKKMATKLIHTIRVERVIPKFWLQFLIWENCSSECIQVNAQLTNEDFVCFVMLSHWRETAVDRCSRMW